MMNGNYIVGVFVGMILSSIAKKRGLKEHFIYFIVALWNPFFAGILLFARLYYISYKEKSYKNTRKEDFEYDSYEDNLEEISDYEEETEIYEEEYKAPKEALYDILKNIDRKEENKKSGMAQDIVRDSFDYDGREFMTKEEKKTKSHKREDKVLTKSGRANVLIAEEYQKKSESKKKKSSFFEYYLDQETEIIEKKAKYESGKERTMLFDILFSREDYLDKVEDKFANVGEETLKREFEIFNNVEAEVEFIRRKKAKRLKS